MQLNTGRHFSKGYAFIHHEFNWNENNGFGYYFYSVVVFKNFISNISAVKKLFEIHVLCCARGNFIEGGLNFKDRLVNPNEDLSVKCECRGLIINGKFRELYSN